MVRKVPVPLLFVVAFPLLVCAQGTASEEAQQQFPERPRVTTAEALERAREGWELGSLAEALDIVRAVLSREPDNVEANLLAGQILIDSNNYNLAREYFLKALDIEPASFTANLGLGKIYLANRSVRQAAFVLEQAEKVAPADRRAETKLALARAYSQMGDVSRALDKAREAVQADPANLDALGALAEIQLALARRDPRRAETALEAADSLVEKTIRILAQTPWNRQELLRLKGAFGVQYSALQTYYYTLVQHNLRREPTDEVLPERISDAAAILNRMAETWRQQALLDLIFSEHDALMLSERAVQFEPENIKYLEYLAVSYQQMQVLTAKLLGPEVYRDTAMSESAVATCQKILAIDPDHEQAKRYLHAMGAPLTPAPGPTEEDSDSP